MILSCWEETRRQSQAHERSREFELQASWLMLSMVGRSALFAHLCRSENDNRKKSNLEQAPSARRELSDELEDLPLSRRMSKSAADQSRQASPLPSLFQMLHSESEKVILYKTLLHAAVPLYGACDAERGCSSVMTGSFSCKAPDFPKLHPSGELHVHKGCMRSHHFCCPSAESRSPQSCADCVFSTRSPSAAPLPASPAGRGTKQKAKASGRGVIIPCRFLQGPCPHCRFRKYGMGRSH